MTIVINKVQRVILKALRQIASTVSMTFHSYIPESLFVLWEAQELQYMRDKVIQHQPIYIPINITHTWDESWGDAAVGPPHRRIWWGGQGGTCPPWDIQRDPSGPGFKVADSNDPLKVSYFCQPVDEYLFIRQSLPSLISFRISVSMNII